MLENTGALKEIIQVRATGENVRYQIISRDTNYFTIVPGNGNPVCCGASRENGQGHLGDHQQQWSSSSLLTSKSGLTLSFSCLHTETGAIMNTYNLDLERNPGLAQTQLLVRAYNMLHPSDSASIAVNITVKPQNLHGPLCSPALIV